MNALFALEVPSGATIVAMIGIIVVIFIYLSIWANRYVKAPPNQVLIVSGRQNRYTAADGTVQTIGFRIVKGGGTFVFPVLERVDVLSLELLTMDLQLKEVYTSQGFAVQIGATARIKINDDDASIVQAARHFPGKGADAMKEIGRPILERHICALLATMSVKEIQQGRALLGSKIQQLAATDMAALGLGIVDITLREVRTGSNS